jgi:cytochrome c oxidase cbb3-type subunit IV
MDVNDLRSIVTVLSMLTFVGIVVWAYRRTNRANFDEAAMLPFADDNTIGRDTREDRT